VGRGDGQKRGFVAARACLIAQNRTLGSCYRGDGQENEYSGVVRRGGRLLMPGPGVEILFVLGRIREWEWYGAKPEGGRSRE